MKRILVIQQVPHEGPGTLGLLAERSGFELDFIRVYKGGGRSSKVPHTIGGYSALLVLGGPMGVYEEDRHPYLRDELRLIESALSGGVPVLGVCLGSQLLARAAGARVYKGDKKEIGWYTVNLTEDGLSDPLFTGLPEELTVFQWHGDTFDVPPGGRNLASSPLFRNQVIRVGRKAYGIQFHIEVTEDMVRDWVEVNSAELEGVKDYIDGSKIIERAPLLTPGLHHYGGVVIRRFLRMITK